MTLMQDRDCGDENDAQDMAATYRRYSFAERSYTPNTAMVNGAVLNAWTGTTDYQPHGMYLITEDGVQLVT